MNRPPSQPSHQTEYLPLDALHLDPENPRLPAEMQGRSEPELLTYIADAFNAVEVGRSIARYGFFPSEPLIAVNENGTYTIVEGNRRLVALKLLAAPKKAEPLKEAAEWHELSKAAQSVKTVPVVIAQTREEVAPIIGYRHISGIQPWDPFAKARFIAGLVDRNMSMDQVADIVGETRTNVASHYRNHQIIKQASDQFNIDTQKVEDEFGVFTRAMSQVALREYIGAPAPAQVTQGIMPIPASKVTNTEELFSWLFGDDTNRSVIRESRDIRQLGDVLRSPNGVEVLKVTRSLEEAELAAGGPRDRLLTLLMRASSNLAAAQHDILEYAGDSEVQGLVGEIRERLEALLPATLHD